MDATIERTEQAARRAERAADQADARARDADRIVKWAVGIMIAGFLVLLVQGERNASALREQIGEVRQTLNEHVR